MNPARLLTLSLLFCLPTVGRTQGKAKVGAERLRPTDGVKLRQAAFDPGRLRARRQALLKSLPKGAVVVVANPKRANHVGPFRPAPDFLYLSGQGGPGLTLLLTRDEDVLFAPPRDLRFERWNGPRLSVGGALAKAAGFGEVVNRAFRNRRIKAALAKHGGPLYLAGLTTKDLRLDAATRARSARSHIARLRQVKNVHEIAMLQRAIDITSAALKETMASLRPGQFEYEAQGVIEYVFMRYGAQRPGFTSIVGSGPNTCVLHYNTNRRQMKAGELVVMDVGAEFHGYTADVTRTVPVSGKFTKRQREIYEIVLAAQKAGFEAVKPGATMMEVHAAASAVIRRAGYRRYFLHGTSHWLGLDVHDVGSNFRPLEPGMVLTVEPGIYIAAEKLGVRIEDDVLVTKTGHRVLSDGVPRAVAAIEALMTKRGVGARAVAPLPARKPAAPSSGKTGKGRFFQVPSGR